MVVPAMVIHPNLTIYPLIPPEANQGWKVELFDLGKSIEPHYHKLQRQYILVVEGQLQAFYGTKEPLILQSSQLVYVDPGIVHSLIPKGRVRFFSIDFPGFNFPEDVFYDEPTVEGIWIANDTEFFPLLHEKYFGSRIEKDDYAVYELVSGSETEEKWSLALLEIHNSPKHFHRIEKEQFIVMNGVLDIEIDGLHQVLREGESITIAPGRIHQLRSASKNPVRVLCASFPAFNPADMHCVE